MTKTAHGHRLRIAVAMLAAALIALAGTQLANSALSDEAFPEDHAPMTFEKDGDIWVASKMHLANLTPKSANSNETDSSVSPDGRKITFASDRDGDFEIYTVGVFGGEVRQVTRNGMDDRNPVWWPDGRGITYAAQYYSSPTHAGIFSTRVDDTDLSIDRGSRRSAPMRRGDEPLRGHGSAPDQGVQRADTQGGAFAATRGAAGQGAQLARLASERLGQAGQAPNR